MSISLDTPEQINAWVLLSRIGQCRLHMKGMTVPGLASWMKKNIPDVTTERTVKAMYPRLLDYCDEVGVGTMDDDLCNYQVLLTPSALNGLYFDMGIVNSISDIEANPTFVEAYNDGRLVITRTMDDVRDRDRSIQMTRA